MSLLFAFAAMLCWGFGDFFIQRCTRKVGDIESLAFIGIIGALLLTPLVIKDFSKILLTQNLLLIAGFSVIIFIVALLNFEALKEGKLSVIDAILEIELPVTIGLSFWFFKETLSIFQLFIISLIFIGIVLIATKSFSHWKTRLEKGVLLAFFAAIGMGIVNFLTATYSRAISPIPVIWATWLVTFLISMLFIVKREGAKKMIKNGLKFKWLILAMGIFDTLAWLFYAYAVFENEISITTAITESYPAIGLFLGLWLNREKIKWYQYAGSFLALISSVILAVTI